MFTFTVEADGDWSIDLQSALDHAIGDGKNFELLTEDGSVNGIDLSALIHAYDTDLDPVQAAAGAFVLSVQDDIAVKEGPAQDAILVDEAGNSLVADLNIDPGADGISLVALFPLDGEGVRLADGSQVYANGEPYEYKGMDVTWQYDSTDGSWDAVVLRPNVEFTAQSTQTTGMVLFTVAPEKIDGEYTGNYTVEQKVDLLEVVEREATITFADAGGGHLTARVHEETSGDFKITFTGDDPSHWPNPDYVNWSNKGIGVGNDLIEEDKIWGNWYTETLKMVFSDTDDNPIDMNEVTIGLNQFDYNPGGQPDEIAHWEAYSYDSGGTRIQVGEGDVAALTNNSDEQSFSIHIPDGSGDTVTFQEVEMSYADNSESKTSEGYRVFSIEGTYEDQDDDLEFDFDAELTDGDGDVEETSFDVTFDADGVVQGGDEPEVIVGSSGEDVLDGGGGDDVIYGGEGNDVIVGGEGMDELQGGAGTDEITGDTKDQSDPANDNAADTFDTSDDPGEYVDYDPTGDQDLLDDLVPPVVSTP